MASNTIIAAFLVVTLLVSLAGTAFMLSSLKAENQVQPASSNTNTGHVKLYVTAPPAQNANVRLFVIER